MDVKVRAFLDLVLGVGPMMLGILYPELKPFIGSITVGIAEAQMLPGATGPEKKAHVMTILEKGITVYNGVGHKPVNPELVMATGSSAIDALIGSIKIGQGLKIAVDPATVPA